MPSDDAPDPAAVVAHTDGAADSPRDVVAPRALHPLSILVGVPLGQIVQSLLVPGAALVAFSSRGTPLVVGIVLAAGLVVRVVQWRRFRFSFDGTVVRIDHGVLARHHRSIDVDRIQQVELDQPAIQRLLGVATVRIETAGSSSEADVELRVLGVADARSLAAAVRRHAGRTLPAATATPASTTVVAVPLAAVARSAVTGAQLLVLPTVVAGTLQLVGSERASALARTAVAVITDTDTFAAWGPPRLLTVAAVGLVVLAASVLAALVVGVVRDGHFRIDDDGDDLQIRRGLLGTRESTVPRARIQSVHVQSNPVRRALGIAAVRIASAGGGSQGQSRVTTPALTRADALALATALLGAGVDDRGLTRHPIAALYRGLVRAVVGAGVMTAAAVGVAAATGWFGAPTRVAVVVGTGAGTAAVALAIADYLALGHRATSHVLVARHGAVVRTLSVAPLDKVQACTTRATWFQRRRSLATCIAHVAGPGGDVEVRDANDEAAAALHTALRRHGARADGLTPRAGPSSDRR